jgi:[ribosomal protein S5]-alanine N-acetyltransferase
VAISDDDLANDKAACTRLRGSSHTCGATDVHVISGRLTYQPVTPETVDAFHALVRDDHVRQFLMDGELFPREWSVERVQESVSLFERRGVGLWLARERTTDELVGFCGFLQIGSMHAEPELVYALFERFSGKGYATEMARVSIDEARRQPGFSAIIANVDEVNVASVRVVEKLGFQPVAARPGSFGNVLLFKLSQDGPRLAERG